MMFRKSETTVTQFHFYKFGHATDDIITNIKKILRLPKEHHPQIKMGLTLQYLLV